MAHPFMCHGHSPETWQQVCPRDTETDRAAALEELLQLLVGATSVFRVPYRRDWLIEQLLVVCLVHQRQHASPSPRC